MVEIKKFCLKFLLMCNTSFLCAESSLCARPPTYIHFYIHRIIFICDTMGEIFYRSPVRNRMFAPSIFGRKEILVSTVDDPNKLAKSFFGPAESQMKISDMDRAFHFSNIFAGLMVDYAVIKGASVQKTEKRLMRFLTDGIVGLHCNDMTRKHIKEIMMFDYSERPYSRTKMAHLKERMDIAFRNAIKLLYSQEFQNQPESGISAKHMREMSLVLADFVAARGAEMVKQNAFAVAKRAYNLAAEISLAAAPQISHIYATQAEKIGYSVAICI